MVCSPIMSVAGEFNLKPTGELKDDGPFEVEFCSGGQWWISRKAILALKPISFFENANGQKEPFYFRIPDDRTEDAEMITMFKKAGFRIAADPRNADRALEVQQTPVVSEGNEAEQKRGEQRA